jgi:hypothetical protein
MSQGSAVHVAAYDQQVYDRLRVPEGQHRSCIHHSLNSAVQSLHICHPNSENLGLWEGFYFKVAIRSETTCSTKKLVVKQKGKLQ